MSDQNITSAYSLLLSNRKQFNTYAQNHEDKVQGFENTIALLSEEEDAEQIADLRAKIVDTRAKARVNRDKADEISNFLNQHQDDGFAGHLIVRPGESPIYSPDDRLTEQDKSEGWSAKRIYYGAPIVSDEEHLALRRDIMRLLDPSSSSGGFVPPLTSTMADVLNRMLSHLRDRRPDVTEESVNE